MGGHPAVHHPEKIKRVLQEVLQVVEKHVAEPSAKQAPQKFAPPMMKSETFSAGMSQ